MGKAEHLREPEAITETRAGRSSTEIRPRSGRRGNDGDGGAVSGPHRHAAVHRGDARQSRVLRRPPDARPLLFGKDDDGAEFCRLGDGLMVGWDRECRWS